MGDVLDELRLHARRLLRLLAGLAQLLVEAFQLLVFYASIDVERQQTTDDETTYYK